MNVALIIIILIPIIKNIFNDIDDDINSLGGK